MGEYLKPHGVVIKGTGRPGNVAESKKPGTNRAQPNDGNYNAQQTHNEPLGLVKAARDGPQLKENIHSNDLGKAAKLARAGENARDVATDKPRAHEHDIRGPQRAEPAPALLRTALLKVPGPDNLPLRAFANHPKAIDALGNDSDAENRRRSHSLQFRDMQLTVHEPNAELVSHEDQTKPHPPSKDTHGKSAIASDSKKPSKSSDALDIGREQLTSRGLRGLIPLSATIPIDGQSRRAGLAKNNDRTAPTRQHHAEDLLLVEQERSRATKDIARELHQTNYELHVSNQIRGQAVANQARLPQNQKGPSGNGMSAQHPMEGVPLAGGPRLPVPIQVGLGVRPAPRAPRLAPFSNGMPNLESAGIPPQFPNHGGAQQERLPASNFLLSAADSAVPIAQSSMAFDEPDLPKPDKLTNFAARREQRDLQPLKQQSVKTAEGTVDLSRMPWHKQNVRPGSICPMRTLWHDLVDAANHDED